jgi:dephospho-CoA kinase
VVLDLAVLVETDLGAGQYDVVVVVEAPLAVRMARLAQRGMTEDDARARIAAQATDEQRRAVAAYVIDNGGDLESLREQTAALWQTLGL